jgi:hypothetical protein
VPTLGRRRGGILRRAGEKNAGQDQDPYPVKLVNPERETTNHNTLTSCGPDSRSPAVVMRMNSAFSRNS